MFFNCFVLKKINLRLKNECLEHNKHKLFERKVLKKQQNLIFNA